ncbi:general secretion pathway protein GspB [Vibrio sp. 99-70-13A1]|uniref:general secretion pathway protein GspB n=1 Tax=Vibrio sp. 99-70-13A1 TaxID=2607601 RepID=UPI001493C305|nr:general secretion pathway protein GspB [Vibrio sp. 99-70-13A1]NOH99115.1 hypothetical protein [Vibrio sp. 99-70-13A1]
MSQIMDALKQSELQKPGLQQSTFYSTGEQVNQFGASSIQSNKKSSVLLLCSLIVVPSLFVVGALYYQWQEDRVQTMEVEVGEPQLQQMSVEPAVASLFSVRPAMLSKDLKPLIRQIEYSEASLVSRATTKRDDNNLQESSQVMVQVEPQRVFETEQQQVIHSSKPILIEPSEPELDLGDIDLTEFSPELALTIESILQDSTNNSDVLNRQGNGNAESGAIDLESNTHLFSGSLPKLNLQTHMYSSNQAKRWVKINGQDRYLGDWITNGVQLIEIKPQSIIVEFQDELIEVPALYEWQG